MSPSGEIECSIRKLLVGEQDSTKIGELTIENRLDRIELYGSLQLTKDKQGFKLAKALQALLNKTVSALENTTDLPDQIAIAKTDTVKNPFD